MRIWVSNPLVIANWQHSSIIFNFHVCLAWVNNNLFYAWGGGVYCSWRLVTCFRNHFAAARQRRWRLIIWQGRNLGVAICISRWSRDILHCNKNRISRWNCSMMFALDYQFVNARLSILKRYLSHIGETNGIQSWKFNSIYRNRVLPNTWSHFFKPRSNLHHIGKTWSDL